MKTLRKEYGNEIKIYFLYLSMFVLSLLPLLRFKYPILVDYPNHLAGFYILSHIDGDAWLSENYNVSWSIQPYFLIEKLGGLLSEHTDVFMAGKILIMLGMALICIGSFSLRKNISGKVDAWGFVFGLFLYNFLLYYGFLSNYIGYGISLIAMGMWIKYRNSRKISSYILFSAISTILYFTHLFALGVYGFFVITYELGMYINGKIKNKVSILSFVTVQFLLPFFLFVTWWISFREYADNKFNSLGVIYEYGGLNDKVIAFLSSFTFGFSAYAIYLSLAILITIFILRVIFSRGIGIYNEMKVPLISFLILILLVPKIFSGLWGADCRIPLIFMLLFVLSIRFEDTEESAIKFRKYFLVVVFSFLTVKNYYIYDIWKKVGEQYQEFESSLDVVNPGSRIITIQDDSKNISGYDAVLYHHMSALAVISRSVFWPNIFTDAHLPIHPSLKTAPIDSPTSAQLKLSDLMNDKYKNGQAYCQGCIVYWENWEQDFDYLVSIRFQNLSIIDFKNLKLKFRGSFFDIYQIVH